MAAKKSDRRIGPYRLAERLGSGGFGTVWAARDERSGSQVAIKILHPKFTHQSVEDGPSIPDRFLSEARMLQRFDHPGVVRIVDVIDRRDHDIIAYVMERLAGCDLEGLKEEVKLPLLLEVMAQAADILHSVHEHDIIHRDVKLANVFVCDPRGEDGEDRPVKLIDFGVAKDLTDASLLQQTAAGVFVGTLAFMAPECFKRLRDPAVELSPAVDQWSMGVALYQALSGGELPFNAPMGPPLALQIEMDPHQPLRMATRFGYTEVPADLDQIVSRCLQKQPELRFHSMAAVGTALRDANAELTRVSGSRDIRHLFRGLPTSVQVLGNKEALRATLDKEPSDVSTLRDTPGHEQPTLRRGVFESLLDPQAPLVAAVAEIDEDATRRLQTPPGGHSSPWGPAPAGQGVVEARDLPMETEVGQDWGFEPTVPSLTPRVDDRVPAPEVLATVRQQAGRVVPQPMDDPSMEDLPSTLVRTPKPVPVPEAVRARLTHAAVPVARARTHPDPAGTLARAPAADDLPPKPVAKQGVPVMTVLVLVGVGALAAFLVGWVLARGAL